jgi:hypothetical protein
LFLRPGAESVASPLELALQSRRRPPLAQQRFGFAGNFEIHQPELYFRKAKLTAGERAVGLQLCPMQPASHRRHARQIAAMGLEFLETAQGRIEAIGSAAHQKIAVHTAQTQFP